VGLRGHCAYQQTPGARRAPYCAAARRNPGVLRQLPRQPRSAGAAQPSPGRRPDCPKRPGPPREPGPALQPGLPGDAG